MRELAFSLLSGVGTGNTRRDRSPVVLHARRKLGPAELAMLDPAWCALPAIDVAGGDIAW